MWNQNDMRVLWDMRVFENYTIKPWNPHEIQLNKWWSSPWQKCFACLAPPRCSIEKQSLEQRFVRRLRAAGINLFCWIFFCGGMRHLRCSYGKWRWMTEWQWTSLMRTAGVQGFEPYLIIFDILLCSCIDSTSWNFSDSDSPDLMCSHCCAQLAV
jgi:hypothetical protein